MFMRLCPLGPVYGVSPHTRATFLADQEMPKEGHPNEISYGCAAPNWATTQGRPYTPRGLMMFCDKIATGNEMLTSMGITSGSFGQCARLVS
jgi:hypothetical protein